MVKYIDWNKDKNEQLIIERGVSFDEVQIIIEGGKKSGLIADIAHPNKSKYMNQRIFLVVIHNYVYIVPYVEDETKIFLKTIIPSRKFTRRYILKQ